MVRTPPLHYFAQMSSLRINGPRAPSRPPGNSAPHPKQVTSRKPKVAPKATQRADALSSPRPLIKAGSVVRLGHGGFNHPAGALAVGNKLVVLQQHFSPGAPLSWNEVQIQGGKAAAPKALPLMGVEELTALSVGSKRYLFVEAEDASGRPAFGRSELAATGLRPIEPVVVRGAPGQVHWLQSAARDAHHLALAFADPQNRAYVAVSSDGGKSFDARPLPSVTGGQPERGVLVHAAYSPNGSLVATRQVADANWAFTSLVQRSTDGVTWSAPISLTTTNPNVHDAFPIARKDGLGVDIYYLRQEGPGGFRVYRRAWSDAGKFGPEQRVTGDDLGHLEKPQPRRQADGSIFLVLAQAQGADTSTDFDVIGARLSADAPLR
jgi:hypothetical protein